VNLGFETRQISVLVVDDSAFMRTALARLIGSDPALSVAGTAFSGADALDKIPSIDPDVITLDVEMPGLDGLQTLRRIMAHFPRPVIMVSAVTAHGAEVTFDALGAGAFDYVPKQLASTSLDISHIRDDLVNKIKTAAEQKRSRLAGSNRKLPRAVRTDLFERDPAPSTPEIVAVGTSTGGPKALQEILPLFPTDFSVPILIVQHMPPGFTEPFAQRLNKLSSVTVREATQNEVIRPGVAYIAPAGIHLLVQRQSDSRSVICLSPRPDNHLHIPSVDIMMQSVAASFHDKAMGVIMTGMGSDGAVGMSAIRREGGLTIGQDEATSAVYGMPRACAEMGGLETSCATLRNSGSDPAGYWLLQARPRCFRLLERSRTCRTLLRIV
jgi:two-component system, chemotaxis family, protein-glutamate methylesterase/glutaminase